MQVQNPNVSVDTPLKCIISWQKNTYKKYGHQNRHVLSLSDLILSSNSTSFNLPVTDGKVFISFFAKVALLSDGSGL